MKGTWKIKVLRFFEGNVMFGYMPCVIRLDGAGNIAIHHKLTRACVANLVSGTVVILDEVLCNHEVGDLFILAQHFKENGEMEPRKFLLRFGESKHSKTFKAMFKDLKASISLEEVEEVVEEFTQATQSLLVPRQEETYEDTEISDLLTGEIH